MLYTESLLQELKNESNRVKNWVEFCLTPNVFFNTKTVAYGDGMWGLVIFAVDDDGVEDYTIIEFCGSNGSCFGEEADDLWQQFEAVQNAAAKYLD